MSKPHTGSRIMRCVVLIGTIFILTLYANVHISSVKAESPAFIRIVHASPDVGTVDVFMDGKKLLSSFQYASVSNYLPLPPGPHIVEVALIGKGIDAPVITQTLPINSGKVYTIAASGMQSTKNLSLQTFEDDNTIAGNGAKVRIYHLSPGTGAVDVTEDARKFVGNITYPEASAYVSIPAGTYTFNVNVMSANANIPISTQLNQWTVTSFFAIGLLSGDPHLKLVTAQTAGMPALPQTGGGPITHMDGAEHFSVWYIVILMCLLIAVTTKSYHWIKVRQIQE